MNIIPFIGSLPGMTLLGNDLLAAGPGAQYSTIQAALTAATSGQTIVASPGVHTVGGTPLTWKSGVSLQGWGFEETQIIDDTGSGNGVIECGNAQNCRFADIHIEQTNSSSSHAITGGSGGDQIFVDNCRIITAGPDALSFGAGFLDAFVRNCIFDGPWDCFVFAGQRVYVDGCRRVSTGINGSSSAFLFLGLGSTADMVRNYCELTGDGTGDCGALHFVRLQKNATCRSFYNTLRLFGGGGGTNSYAYQYATTGIPAGGAAVLSIGDTIEQTGDGEVFTIRNDNNSNTTTIEGPTGSAYTLSTTGSTSHSFALNAPWR